MDEAYGYLMFIFGLGILLYGIYIYTSKNPLIPKYYKKTVTKKYRHYVGKIVMMCSLSPVLSGISSFVVKDMFFLSFLILVVSFIGILIFSIRHFKEE